MMEITEIKPFLVTSKFLARLENHSSSPDNYLRLKVPVNSHTI